MVWKLLFVIRYSRPSSRMMPSPSARNCSSERLSFPRSFGRREPSFPMFDSHRMGVSPRSYFVLILSG